MPCRCLCLPTRRIKEGKKEEKNAPQKDKGQNGEEGTAAFVLDTVSFFVDYKLSRAHPFELERNGYIRTHRAYLETNYTCSMFERISVGRCRLCAAIGWSTEPVHILDKGTYK